MAYNFFCYEIQKKIIATSLKAFLQFYCQSLNVFLLKKMK